MNPPDDARVSGLAGGLLAAVALLAGLDIGLDLVEGVEPAHVAIEGAIAVVGAVGAAVLGRRWRRLNRAMGEVRRENAALSADLAASRAEADRWRAEAGDLLSGLSAAIDRQFVRWDLSPAEAEVGLLMLKGLSHKEIAAIRAVSEATVRQQARAVYRKADVGGRHGLLAFFLEDLMLPDRPAPT